MSAIEVALKSALTNHEGLERAHRSQLKNREEINARIETWSNNIERSRLEIVALMEEGERLGAKLSPEIIEAVVAIKK